MLIIFYLTNGERRALRADDNITEDVLKVYGYPDKVGITKIEINHGDGFHKNFVPE